MGIDDRSGKDLPDDDENPPPRDEHSSEDGSQHSPRGEQPSQDDSTPPPQNDNSPDDDEPDVDQSYGLVPTSGAMMPYRHGPGPLRDNIIAILGSLFGNTTAHMNMVMQNLPNAMVDKKVAKNGVTVRHLPNVFDGVDSYFKQITYALSRNQDLVPDEVELQNIKHAFLTLRMIQTELTNLVETYGQPKTERSERLTPKPYVEKDMQQGKRTTALDIGAVLGGRSRRSPQLSASEQATLKLLSADIGFYSMIAAHLVGAQVVGFDISEKENLDKHVEREEIDKIMAVTPPQPWADAMKKLKIQLPMIEAKSFRIVTR
jgi:hypothetical protein